MQHVYEKRNPEQFKLRREGEKDRDKWIHALSWNLKEKMERQPSS